MSKDEPPTTRVSAVPAQRWIEVLRYSDVVVLAIATAPVLVLGAPVLGYLIGALSWVAQRALAQLDRRWIRHAIAPRMQTGLSLFEAFGRIWLLAGAIIAAGVIGGRADGLTAAVTIFGAYSIAFAIKVIDRPDARPQTTAPVRPQSAPPAQSALRPQVASPARPQTTAPVRPQGAAR